MKRLMLSALLGCLIAFNSYSLSIDEVMQSISSNNTELKVSNAEIQTQLQQIKSSNNLNDPQIDMEYLFGQKAIGDKWQIGISQSFDWPGAYKARSKANLGYSNALEYSARMKKLEVLLKAKLLCIELVNLNKMIDAQQVLSNNISNLLSEYNKGFKHGEISILDINKLKLEMFNADQNLLKLKSQRTSLAQEIVGLNANVEISNLSLLNEYSAEKLDDIDSYMNAIKIYDPECGYYASLNKASKEKLNATKLEGWPKMAVGYKYANELGDKFHGFTVGLSIPLFSNRNKVNVAKAESIAYQFGEDNAYVLKEAQVKSDYAKVVELKSQIASYKNILNDDSNILILKKALDGGQMTLLNYLLEIRCFIDARNSLISREYEYQSLMCELNKYQLLK